MSTLKVNTIQDTSGNTQYTAKAWVNFNGTGTPSIRASGNVSSITDTAAAKYTVNFSTAFADTNYVMANSVIGYSTTAYAGAGMQYDGSYDSNALSKTTSSCLVKYAISTGGVAYDVANIDLIFFR